MKKKILMTMIVSVMTSLGCQASWTDSFYGSGMFFYELHYDSEGNTATIVAEDWGDPIYGGYHDHLVVNSIITYRKTKYDPYDEFLITAIENVSGKRGVEPMGLSDRVAHTIKLASSVKYIGDLAMTDNGNLKSVEMPGVRTIGKEALVNNPYIRELIELRELENLGERAFAGCKKLPELRFGPTLRFVGKDAFEGCESLKIIDIWHPNTWSRVEFNTATANPITLAKSFNVNGNDIYHLDIDTHNEYISAYSFNSAENLRSVRISNASYIGESAFDRCVNLADICLDVDSVGNYAFANTESIRRVYVMTEKPPKANASTFFDYNNATLYVPKGSLEAYRNTEYCWRFFREIKESDFSEVEDIFRADYDTEDPSSVESVEKDEREDDEAIDTTKPMEVYTMQGQLVSRSMEGIQPGLYILRQGRKAKKVLIGHQ